MKILKYILPTLLLAVLAVSPAEAKRVKKPVYIFGFSASFKDSVVYITDVQEVANAWTDTKTHFLLGRESYSSQLKDYFTNNMQQGDRVCLVFYAHTKRKAVQEFEKIKKKYTEKSKISYDVRQLPVADFRFEVVDMSEQE